jgi:hypothetical protein
MQQLFYFEQLKQGQGVEKVVMMLESSLMPAALPSVEARSRAGMLRMVAAAALLCGLTCAALVVSWSGISPTRLLGDEENMPWKPFPVPGLNTGYTKLAAAFEAGHFDAAPRLPKIGFDKMPSIGWNGTLPVEPVRENEVNHGFVEKPFERLPAPLQANISAAHALEAAEVAQKAFSGGGGGAEEGEVLNDGGVKGEAQEQRPAESPAAAKAVKGEGMLTSLQKTAEALTTKAEEAVNAFKQAERRISNDKQRAQRANIQSDWQRDEEATFAHQAQSTGPLPGEDARKDIPKAFAKSGAPETHASEEAALLSAKRMVDSALRRLASKKERLQQGREGEVDDGERGEGEGEREGDQVKEQLSHAQQALYDKYQREYYAALRHTEEREFPHFEERETPKTWGVGFHDEARRQALDLSGGGVRQIKVEHDAGDVMAANWKHVSAIPTSGPFERATIVKDVPVRIWPMVGQYGHTHSWPYVAMNGDLVAQNEDPPVAPSKCADDPISVDCTGVVLLRAACVRCLHAPRCKLCSPLRLPALLARCCRRVVAHPLSRARAVLWCLSGACSRTSARVRMQ